MVANREGRWDEDAVDGGPSSMELLLVWLRRDDNAARWRQAIERRMQATIAREVHEFFVDHGITHRTVSGIRSKLWQLGRQVGEADDWLASKGLLHVDGNEKARRTVMRLCPDYLETGGRVDIRNVKIKTFDGSVAQDDFDSNVKDMWEELLDQARIDVRSIDVIAKVDRALEVLVEVVETDGKARRQKKNRHDECYAVEQSRTKSTESDKFDPKQPKASKKRSAQAQVMVVERKKKKTASGGSHQSTSINCYECGQIGHTAAYHRKYSSGNSSVNDEMAHANQAPTRVPKTANEWMALGGAQSY
ncbi:hypothetical protein JG688_00002366 [Phytophthora aleatoria]|uniref:Uncharacterized protein n=1 Tax=Phytophthora aleatoria TaxID=2496075 RepID=A0A8J5J5R6_9STRA|nr:hypothetical protein JG688_00002366 [Phytophthora aleatoria]